jgi:hypothetical protein
MESYELLVVSFGNVDKKHNPCPQGLRTRGLNSQHQPECLEELADRGDTSLTPSTASKSPSRERRRRLRSRSCSALSGRITVRSTTPPGTVDELNRRYENRVSHITGVPEGQLLVQRRLKALRGRHRQVLRGAQRL